MRQDIKKNNDGTYDIKASKKDNEIFNQKSISEQSLPDYVGKEMANKIIEAEKSRKPTATGTNYARGLDLEVGGEGMKGFYDQMLPKWTDKYIKKYDSKVEVKKLANGQEVWSFKVTDKMKKELKGKGQALYSGVATAATIGATQQEDKK